MAGENFDKGGLPRNAIGYVGLLAGCGSCAYLALWFFGLLPYQGLLVCPITAAICVVGVVRLPRWPAAVGLALSLACCLFLIATGQIMSAFPVPE